MSAECFSEYFRLAGVRDGEAVRFRMLCDVMEVSGSVCPVDTGGCGKSVSGAGSLENGDAGCGIFWVFTCLLPEKGLKTDGTVAAMKLRGLDGQLP